jgi:hypothetical protein
MMKHVVATSEISSTAPASCANSAMLALACGAQRREQRPLARARERRPSPQF